MSSIVVGAAQLARQAHQKQKRKWSGRPYIEHPARVAGMVATHPLATDEMVAAAFLHDTLEDTDLSQEQIEKVTNHWTYKLVRGMTNDKNEGLSRAARKALDRQRLQVMFEEVKIIKLYDRIDNLQDMRDAPGEFKVIYAGESILLADAIGDVDVNLKLQLISLARSLIVEAEQDG